MNHVDSDTHERLRDDPTRRSLIACITEIPAPEDLIGIIAAARRNGEPVFYWEKPTDQLAIAAIGSTWQTTAAGTDRFRSVASEARELAQRLRVEGSSALLDTPPLVGGFSFGDHPPLGETWAGFAAARLFLPRTCIVRRAGHAALMRSAVIDPASDIGALARDLTNPELPSARADRRRPESSASFEHRSTPSRESWMDRVRDAVDSIRDGELDKLVLACSQRVVGDRAFDLESVLRSLREREDGCTVFCVSAGDAEFVGATPETLATLRGGELETSAIAGTAARGDSVDEDGVLRQALELSGKDRSEHEIVVRGICDDLRPLCESIDREHGPRVMRLRNVQHLRTPIRARLRPGRSLLDVVAALHPSPAVGGYPKAVALDELGRREDLERGWYAAPVGWTTVDGDGEFAVALRSGLLRGREATAFAGAGIVRNSNPRAELAEIDLKLAPMVSALTRPR